jgi:hypothetical protein
LCGLAIKPLLLGTLALIAVLVIASLLTTEHQKKGTTVLLVGLSPSERAAQPTIRACADAVVQRVVKDGDRLYVGPVGRAPSAAWEKVDTALSGSATSNPLIAEQQRKRSTTKAEAAVGRVLSAVPAFGTSDQIAAGADAARLLSHEHVPQTIVFCSDMHQVGATLNVYHESLDSAKCQRVQAAIAASQPSDLTDVRVIVGAAGLDGLARFSVARETAIQRFWVSCWAPAVHAASVTYDSVLHR